MLNCRINDCVQVSYCRGMCTRHYDQTRKGRAITNRSNREANLIEIKDSHVELVLSNLLGQEVGRTLVDARTNLI